MGTGRLESRTALRVRVASGCSAAAELEGESGTRSLQRVRKQACAREAMDDGGPGTGGVPKRHAGTESGMRERRRGTEIQGRQEHA